MSNLEVLFTPAEFDALRQQDLSETVCVVFDVLRATSTMITALANGAASIVPVAEISEAMAIRRDQPGVLLAGERHGLRVRASLTGGVDFDLGNSPREFTRERVEGRKIVMTTTNGTRALRACAGARLVVLGSFLNLGATATFLTRGLPPRLMLVCSGTGEEAAYEDVLAAGALCNILWPSYANRIVADSAQLARTLFEFEGQNLLAAMDKSRNAKCLRAQSQLADDIAFCLQRDHVAEVVCMNRAGQVVGENCHLGQGTESE